MSRPFLVVDTEGVDAFNHNDGKAHGESALFYDFGAIVADREGRVYERFSFANSDVITNKKLMSSAYYADKLPQYFAGIGTEWQLADTLTIWETVQQVCKEYGIRDVWAFNARYDQQSTNFTIAQKSNGFRRYFLPYKTGWRDIWDYSGSTICNTKKYVKWCYEHDFITESGNPRTNADTVGKYILQDLDFNEQHTALSDCEIELKILLAAFKRNKKARHSKGQGWRDAAKIAKELGYK